MLTFFGYILICLGLFFFLGASLGILRFPDFYTRMHAAGKADTLSTILMLFGVILYDLHDGHFTLNDFLVAIKLFFIVVFVFIGSPTASHLMMKAGYDSGIAYWTKQKKE
tara:strand:+ start:298 stop:627 length:330 start_codon:yes stop_codon:yes gene_type:complete